MGSDFFGKAYPKELREAEARLLCGAGGQGGRRQAAGLDSPTCDPAEGLPRDTFGVALSGGGIRSATLCLGFFQALARADLLKSVDFLSTVSGGGYFGAFLGRWFARVLANPSLPGPGDKEEGLASHNAPPLRFLRENGRYLSPNGAGDSLLAAAVALRNLVAIHVVLGATLLALFLLANLLRAATGIPSWGWTRKWVGIAQFSVESGDWLWWSPYLWLPLVVFLLSVLPLGWAYWFTTDRRVQRVPKNPPVGDSASPKDFPAWSTGAGVAIAGFLLFKFWLSQPALGLPDWASSAIQYYGLWAGLVGLEAGLALAFWRGAVAVVARQAGASGLSSKDESPMESYPTRRIRNLLSRWLKGSLVITLALLAFALVDTLGQSLYALASKGGLHDPLPRLIYLPVAGGLTLLAAASKWLLPLLERVPSRRRFRVPLEVLAAVAAIGLAIAEASVLCGVTHGVAWGWDAPDRDPGALLRWSQSVPAVSLSMQQHIVVSETVTPGLEVTPSAPPEWAALGLASIAALLLAWAFARTLQFLNLSSHHALYRARLTRAYLGATNRLRWSEAGKKVTDDLPGDSCAMEDYRPHQSGGPLHLINLTLNETVEGRSQIQQRDRKGLSMAVGPCGISIGKGFHAIWNSLDPPLDNQSPAHNDPTVSTSRVLPLPTPPSDDTKWRPFHAFEGRRKGKPLQSFPTEALDLGAWVAISGAAFSTGMGAKTGLGFSLLLGLLNVRTGYWWDSGVDPLERTAGILPEKWGARICKAFPVPCYLAGELLGRFHGLARRKWNLSDGGHFENTGAYELLRRRVPNILICDCGADPEYQFSDFANLVRKARTDFGVEITTVDKISDDHKALWKGPLVNWSAVGTLKDLAENRRAWTKGRTLPHRATAVLAEVKYTNDSTGSQNPHARPGLLLLAKPAFSGDEPADLQNYGREHAAFPQEPTMDQFFDEAQWESYRKLGEHIGERLFSGAGGDPTKRLEGIVKPGGSPGSVAPA